jgi:hypothetical protein
LVKVTQDKFLTVDIQAYELNGLEEPINLTIKYRDGQEALVRTKEEIEELAQTLDPKKSLAENVSELKKHFSFIDPSEVVCFFNNPSHRPNLEGAEEIYLDDL